MSNADASETRLSYVEETAWGTTPATPGFFNVRMTDEDFADEKNTSPSNEIRADGEVSDHVELGRSGAGGFGFELSYGNFHTLFEHALRGTFAQAATAAQQLDTTAPDQITRPAGSFHNDGFMVGDSATLAGSATNDGVYTISAISADGSAITTVEAVTTESGSGDETLTAAGSDVLKGALEKKSFTFEKTFETGVADQFFRYPGSRTNQLDLNFTSNDFTTGRLAYMAERGLRDTVEIAGATYQIADTNPVMTALDVVNLTLGGVTATLYVSEFSMSLANNCRAQPAVGFKHAIGVAYGRREITGSLSAYLNEDAAGELYDAFDTHADGSLAWDVVEKNGTNTYGFRIPSLRYTAGLVPTPGNNQDVFLQMEWGAKVDNDAGTSIIITK